MGEVQRARGERATPRAEDWARLARDLGALDAALAEDDADTDAPPVEAPSPDAAPGR